ncbi:MAG: hypothetical protein QF362_02785 [Candidatus Woesearchaeota archaeon]|jgi:hypothetical protein|nr:hypothetical protein [Candidatus Woesearchaeota archaeon]MDP7506343.1 hypothetical protein [Candidatus Woesearchaeota archaeon]|tara:strand:+ start:223 stop:636 length:414 start_codon:yes stop_codon:yes gene_type:complete
MKEVLGIVNYEEYFKKNLMEEGQREGIEFTFVDPEGTPEEIAQALEVNPDLVFFNLIGTSHQVVDKLRDYYRIIKESPYKGTILTTSPSRNSVSDISHFYRSTRELITDHTLKIDGVYGSSVKSLTDKIKKYLKAEE